MLNRLNRIPLNNKNYEKELKTIKQIATNNGYKESTVIKLNNKIKRNNKRQKINQDITTTPKENIKHKQAPQQTTQQKKHQQSGTH
jgi:hypothetical protein